MVTLVLVVRSHAEVVHIHEALQFEDKLDLSHLSTSISAVQNATFALDQHTSKVLAQLAKLARDVKGQHRPCPKRMRAIRKLLEEVRKINGKLAGFEGGFIDEAGLPGREWYRHLGVAPGMWLGYGTTTFPAVTEALTLEGDVAHANAEAERVAILLDAMADRLMA